MEGSCQKMIYCELVALLHLSTGLCTYGLLLIVVSWRGKWGFSWLQGSKNQESFVTLALGHHTLCGLDSIGPPRRVSAIEKSTGKSSMLTITNEKGSLSKEQIDEMIQARLQFHVLVAWIHVVSLGVCAFAAAFRKRLPEYERISETGHPQLISLQLMRMWLCDYICCAQNYVSDSLYVLW